MKNRNIITKRTASVEIGEQCSAWIEMVFGEKQRDEITSVWQKYLKIFLFEQFQILFLPFDRQTKSAYLNEISPNKLNNNDVTRTLILKNKKLK